MHKSISIISDWKRSDFYTTVLETRLQQLVPDARLSVISHDVSAYDSMQAAFILRAAWQHFPKGSIHLNCVNSSSSSKSPHVLIVHKSHVFIGADLGFWPFICQSKPDAAYLIHDDQHYDGSSFPEVTVFTEIAAAIAKGLTPEKLGLQLYDVQENIALSPIAEDNQLLAGILYFDSYGNAMTNVTVKDFEDAAKGRKFVLKVMSERNLVKRISSSYYDVKQGEFIALFNSLGLLEVAIREGDLLQLLSLEVGKQFRIEFL